MEEDTAGIQKQKNRQRIYYPVEENTAGIQKQKNRQRIYYDRHIKELKPIQPGQTIQMRQPGENTWTIGKCIKTAGPRSYEVQVGGSKYRRNRRQLILIDKATPTEELTTTAPEEEGTRQSSMTTEPGDISEQEMTTAGPADHATLTSPLPEGTPPLTENTSPRRSQ